MVASSRVEVPWLVLFVLAVLPGGLLVAVLTRPSPEPVTPDPAVAESLEEGLTRLHEDLIHIEELLEARPSPDGGPISLHGTLGSIPPDRAAQAELRAHVASLAEGDLGDLFGWTTADVYAALGKPDLVGVSDGQIVWTYTVETEAGARLTIAFFEGVVVSASE